MKKIAEWILAKIFPFQIEDVEWETDDICELDSLEIVRALR